MASIAIMIIGGNYLAKYLSGNDGKGALAGKTLHDKALEAYQTTMAKFTSDRTKLLDWIETSREIKEKAKQNFTFNTDYVFKLYDLAHPDQQITPSKEPRFSDFYRPSEQQERCEYLFVGGSAFAFDFAALRFL